MSVGALFIVLAAASVSTLADYGLTWDEPYYFWAQEKQRSCFEELASRVAVLGSERMRALDRLPAVYTASFDGVPLVRLFQVVNAGAGP